MLKSQKTDQEVSDLRGDWSPSEFRTQGEFLLEQLEDWFSNLRSQPVRPPMRAPQEVLAEFNDAAPKHPEAFEDVVRDTIERVFKGSVIWQHPRHHAYFSHSSSGPAILAEACAAALDTNLMVWDAAPAPVAVEHQVLQWLASLAGVDWSDFDSVFTNGASQSTMVALAAARESLSGYDFRTLGASGGPVLRVYCSEQTHSSIDKAAITLGIGLDNIIRVSDSNGMLDSQALAKQIAADRAHGLTPLAVVATVGTTSTAAIEPVESIAHVAQQYGIWLHVDAAFGGLWRASSQVGAAIPSFTGADSVVVNPHKVLFTPLEASALYCKRSGALINAFALVPEYLRTPVADARHDYMNYSTQLGRQFRGLKIWWIIRCFGTEGIRARLDYAIELADRLKGIVARDAVWELAADTPLPLLCIRPRLTGISVGDADALCQAVHNAINQDGRSAVSHARIKGRYVIRISIGNIHTQWADLETLWNQITAMTSVARETVRDTGS